MKKISKKEYINQLQDLYYFMGTVYGTNINQVIDLLKEKAFKKDDIIKSQCYYKATYNSVDFLHNNVKTNIIMYENKKGLFYSIIINNIKYLLHDYKDGSISVKAIL